MICDARRRSTFLDPRTKRADELKFLPKKLKMAIIKEIKKIALPFVLVLLFGNIVLSENLLLTQETGMSEQIKKIRKEAVKWLSAQIVPNTTIPLPAPYRRRLILSYRIPSSSSVYPHLFGRSFIYDNALAIIAFTMVKDYQKAEYILGALMRLLSDDGSLWSAYNTNNSWPSNLDHQGAIKRLGAIAWVGYSAVYYLGKRLETDKAHLEQDVLAADYLEFAKKIARFIISRQVMEPSDKRYGLITGGSATLFLKVSEDFNKIMENYNPAPIYWISTEHNIDAYFFIRDLGRITGDGEYIKKADLIKKGLLKIWSKNDSQFFRGIKETQRIDQFLPLDGASWGAFFLFSLGEDEKATQCLKATNNFFTISKGIKGYAPYYKETVYENDRVNQFYYREKPNMTWRDLNLVWVEGSLGVAAAFIRAGNFEKGAAIINAMMRMQDGGGFQYASIEIPFQFSIFPSVASTAWFVIATELYLNQDKLFWGN